MYYKNNSSKTGKSIPNKTNQKQTSLITSACWGKKGKAIPVTGRGDL
jgi:hypothetical protein